MTETRKPPGTTWQGFAEQRIREAEADGVFNNLPGLGQPIPGIDDPLDENWWVKRKLRDEGVSVVSPILEARLEKERVLNSLSEATSEREVRRRLEQLNARIRAALASPIPGPPEGVPPVEIEAVLAQWRDSRKTCSRHG
jgi:hypothetical protein